MNMVKGMCCFPKRITWLIAIVVCFFALLDAKGQDSLQLDLLREAYEKNSSELLFDFFDHWSAEIQSNEGEGEPKDIYVAEAEKVFKSFYQPLKLKEIGYDYSDLYNDCPYFIVQGKLRKISLAEQVILPEEVDSFLIARIRQRFQGDDNRLMEWIEAVKNPDNNYGPVYGREEWWPPFFNIRVLTMDYSDIEFRPDVQFDGKKTVYLTEEYVSLLNLFFSESPVYHSDTVAEISHGNCKFLSGSDQRMNFIRKAAYIIPGHWEGIQYETFPIAHNIIFNIDMNRAVVQWECHYHGGDAVLVKQDGEWVVVSCRSIWME